MHLNNLFIINRVHIRPSVLLKVLFNIMSLLKSLSKNELKRKSDK